eukprot:TRINITY_DN1821_c1_g1_i1.p1 TRINITY_DN1821_c1_g1~~TRINITY_DN1821_c1_g1_i1.p1  ORF type:complete len:209 (-),score=76.59 TRINITY_DN1821_c1_g1_i1:619-1245(-)
MSQELQSEQLENFHELFETIKKESFISNVSEIFLWEDKIATSLIFLIVNFYFILLLVGEYTFVSITAYILFFMIVLNSAIININLARSTSFFEKLKNAPPRFDKELILRITGYFVDAANIALSKLRKAFVNNNQTKLVQYAASLFILSWIGNWLSIVFICHLITIGLFIIPSLYAKKKQQIDKLLNKIEDLTNKLNDKLPSYLKSKLD